MGTNNLNDFIKKYGFNIKKNEEYQIQIDKDIQNLNDNLKNIKTLKSLKNKEKIFLEEISNLEKILNDAKQNIELKKKNFYQIKLK